MANGDASCCGKGGSWHGKCGDAGEPDSEDTWTGGENAEGSHEAHFEYTWAEGKKACRVPAPTPTAIVPALTTSDVPSTNLGACNRQRDTWSSN